MAVSRKWRNYPLVINHAHICTEMIAPLTLSIANDSELLAYGISLALLLPAVCILNSFSVLIDNAHMHNYIWASIWNWYEDGSRQANLGWTRVSGFKLIRKWWLSWKAHWTRFICLEKSNPWFLLGYPPTANPSHSPVGSTELSSYYRQIQYTLLFLSHLPSGKLTWL